MSRKKKFKLLIDMILIIAMLAAMANKLTENRLHELIGISMFVLLTIHNLLNWRWYGAIFRGEYNFQRRVNCTINLLLVAVLIVLAASSLMISKSLFAFPGKTATLELRQIHTTAAYWLLLLSSVHLGLHWQKFSNALKKTVPAIQPASLPVAVRLLLAVTVVGYGATTVWVRDIYSRLIMVYAFDFWDYSQSAVGFFVSYLSVIAAIVIITHAGLKIVTKTDRELQKASEAG